MVLPLPIYAVKFLGLFQGVYFTHLSRKPLNAIRTSDVTDCALGPPSWLLIYRALAFLYALALGTSQLARTGTRVFAFFTVWNWWLLTFYFGLATLVSARALLRRAKDRAELPAGILEKTLVVIYHVESPLVWVIDATTWLILVPMLLSTPDQAKREYWVSIMFSFTSYNQHGFNAVMLLVELVLSRTPASLVMSGYMALWLSAFSAWSTFFFWRTGRWIYPFLDAHKPYAWLGYLGLYASFWAGYGLFMGLHRAKARLLAGWQRRQQLAQLERKVQ